MTCELISLSLRFSSSRAMPLTSWSMRSWWIGRLRIAIWMERVSLSRSKGTRSPLRFTMVRSRICTRSKVVKRALHCGQALRRRIAE